LPLILAAVIVEAGEPTMASVLDREDLSRDVLPVPLPDHYELVNGNVVEPPPMSAYSSGVSSRLNRALSRYLDGNDLGWIGVEQLYRIPQEEDRGRNRRPDVSYVSYERWAKDRPIPFTGNAWDVVPDLVAEVVSPGDLADELLDKVREYLRGGVRLVWIVYPLVREVHAYLPGGRDVRVFFEPDELEAAHVLPGFRTGVAALFPPVEMPPRDA
jgi:Uma2 family endonuclease